MTLVQQNPQRLFDSLRASLQVVATSTEQLTTRMTGPASGIITGKHDILHRPNMEGGLRPRREGPLLGNGAPR